MTPKMRGALESLKQMQHTADVEADKLTKRIEGETMPALMDGFKVAHTNVDNMHSAVNEIYEFADELKKTNGGDPLSDSDRQSPRSSEVASK